MHLQCIIKIVNGEVKESGRWYDSDGTWGEYEYSGQINTGGSCPAFGQENDEPWVEPWQVKTGCPNPICPEPMLDIIDKWSRYDKWSQTKDWFFSVDIYFVSTISIINSGIFYVSK